MDGSKSPTSTKSALFLLVEFYFPAQINSNDDLLTAAEQCLDKQHLQHLSVGSLEAFLIEGAFKKLQVIIAPTSCHQRQAENWH